MDISMVYFSVHATELLKFKIRLVKYSERLYSDLVNQNHFFLIWWI